MREASGLRYWRRSPLRRRTDLAEAWVAVTALLLTLLAAPVAGAVVGQRAQDALQRSVREQRASRHLVGATVVRGLPGAPLETDPEGTSGQDARSRVVAGWTAPDGTPRRAEVLADLASPSPGDRFELWTDARGSPVARPLDPATATTHAVFAGFGAALVCAGLVEAARRLAVRLLVRRRYDRWDQAWERAGPDWGRTGAGG